MFVLCDVQTTLLRDVARLMSLPPDQGGLGMSVVIVDTSNEIAGKRKRPTTALCVRLFFGSCFVVTTTITTTTTTPPTRMQVTVSSPTPALAMRGV